jgi:hypothetical protein
MANRAIKQYGLESIAKMLIMIGGLLVLASWVVALYYFGFTDQNALFIAPVIFTCVFVVTLLVIKYRYTLFERYPYLMTLPSLFYRIDKSKQASAFSMIFTVHALVVAFLGLMSLLLTISISTGVKKSSAAFPFLYLYIAVVAILIVAVLWQYRRIYIRFIE